MITITKRGPVYLTNKSDFILCNRPGIVVESIKDCETTICVNSSIENPYTISHASKGTLVSFFSISRKEISNNLAILDKAWFVDFERAYFLCTLNQLDGYESIRGNQTISDIIYNLSNLKEQHFQELDKDYAYTFSLDSKGKLKLIYLWDIECQRYISPLSKLWITPDFCIPQKYIVKKDGISKQLTDSQMRMPLVDCYSGVKLIDGKPLLITIYCDQTVYTIRVMTRLDFSINKIRNSAPGKFEALLLARLKGENTVEYEKRYFTEKELQEFNIRIKLGFNKFKEEIYQKSVLRNWVCFPDKIYNTIRLGDIIDSKLSVEEKQDTACKAIKSCTKGWRKKALFDFCRSYIF